MAFFRNDAVNRVNLHAGVQALAHNAGHIFLLVFLVRAGVSVPVALLAQAGIVAGRFVLRPALLPLAKWFGLKPLMIAGALVIALQYPLLGEVHGLGLPLRFQLATEAGWDVGCFAACLLAAALFAAGAPPVVEVLLVARALLAGFVLLRRCYARPTLV